MLCSRFHSEKKEKRRKRLEFELRQLKKETYNSHVFQSTPRLTCISIVLHSSQATVSRTWVALAPLTPHSTRPKYSAFSLMLAW